MGKHYIPREYLRGFQTSQKSNTVFRYEKSSSVFLELTLESVAQMRDLYPPEVEDTITHDYENPANSVLKKLRNHEYPTFEERFTLINYIILLWQRSPYKLKATKENINAIIPKRIKEIKLQTSQMIKEMPSQKTFLENRCQLIIEKYLDGSISSKEIWLRMLINLRFPLIRSTLLQMNWYLITATDNDYFITGDAPFFFTKGIGLSKIESEVLFPISSNTLLWLSWLKLNKEIFNVNHQVVIETNKRMVINSERYIYSSRQSEWILKYCLTEQIKTTKANFSKSLLKSKYVSFHG